MPNIRISPVDENVTLEQLIEEVAKLQRMVNYLMNKGLDTENVREIGSWIVDNDKLMSAEPGVYPRVELEGSSGIVRVYYDATKLIRITPLQASTPAIIFSDGTYGTFFIQDGDLFGIATSSNLSISGGTGTSLNNVSLNGGTKLGTIPVSNSSASTVAGIVSDFNALLTVLRAMKIIA